jgi:hypothetical protein
MNAIEGLERLARAVGSGELSAVCTVDQPYAQRQHEELEWSHPRGGQAKYLESPLFANYSELMRIIASSLITASGSDIVGGMSRAAEEMSQWVEDYAPRLDHILMYSGHPQVHDNSAVVYNRPPKIARVEK